MEVVILDSLGRVAFGTHSVQTVSETLPLIRSPSVGNYFKVTFLSNLNPVNGLVMTFSSVGKIGTDIALKS